MNTIATPIPAPLEREATVMAINIIAQRAGRLSTEDQNDLLELVAELPRASAQEREEIIATLWEILGGYAGRVAQLPPAGPRPVKLENWVRFISERIHELRRKKGWTQEELARKIGLPQSHVSRLEAGKHSPSGATIDKLAAAFGIPVGELDPGRED